MRRRYLTFIAVLFSSLPALAQEDLEQAVDNSLSGAHTLPAEAAGHATSGLPQFNPEYWPSQAFWLIVCFGLFYLVFGRLILPSLGKTIETRREKVAGDLRQAEHLSAEAQTIRDSYETELKKSSASAASAMKEVDDASKAKLDTALSDFRKRYEARMQETETNIAAAKQAALADISKIAAEIAAQAAEKIAGIPADKNQAEALIRDIQTKQRAA